MSKADLISVRCRRGVLRFYHFGIDIGDGTVVHLATTPNAKEMTVQRVSLMEFSGGEPITVETANDSLADELVVERALTAVGQTGYHLVAGNCEHFAREIKSGRCESVQVDMYVSSVVRTAFSGIAMTASRHVVAGSIAVLSKSKLLVTVGSLVPTLLAETARCGSYMAARKLNMSHENANVSSRSVGHAASAIGGFVVGGPAGSLGALAISVAADQITESIQRKLRAGEASE